MARFVKKGTGKKAEFKIDTEASTSKNNQSPADKAKAAKEAEESQAATSAAEGDK